MQKKIKKMHTDLIISYLNKCLINPLHNIIIANGLFPKKTLFLLENNNLIVCCDGAIIKLIKNNIVPNYIVGDCDSVPQKIYLSLMDKIIKVEEQDTNDLTKAVNFCKNKLCLNDIVILGATGLREDHTISNIFLLFEYFKLINNVSLISDFGIFTAHLGLFKLNTVVGQQVSFYSPYSNSKLSCINLKWPLKEFILQNMYQGSLNEATDVFIEGNAKDPIIIFRGFEYNIYY